MGIRLAFTTLGCPAWDLATIVRRAVEYGYAGVDFRGYLADVDLRKSPAFTTGLRETVARVRDAGLVVPCVSSSAKMCCRTPEDRQQSLDEIQAYAELARAFNAGFVRIFGGRLQGWTHAEAMAPCAEMLRAAAAIGRAAGITVVVETHDDWVATAPLRQAFETAGWPDGVGILWDVHHPFRQEHETPAQSYANIGRQTRYTHWKDSRPAPDGKGQELCLVGEGDVPLRELFGLLHGGGYDGWYALEWEKRWKASIPEPEIALPRFVQWMRAREQG